MPFKVEVEGKEVEGFYPEEVEARVQEAIKPHMTAAETAKADAEAARAEAEKYKRVSMEKTENFKRYKDMTEEEKGKLTAEQTEAIKRADAAEAKAAEAEAKVTEFTTKSLESLKNKIIREKSGGDADLQKKLEENWNLINLEGNDEETFQKRGDLAFNMLGLAKPKTSPFNRMGLGDAPPVKGEKFTETDKGKAAEAVLDQQLGIAKK